MCNGYPAPRCSRHALNLLNDAKNELERSVNWGTKEKAERKLRKAEKVYYMTPAGFKFLEEEIKNASNPLVKDELFAKLMEGKKDRKEALLNASRVKRENKNQLIKAKEMRSTGLPNWVIASQLNAEFLESQDIVFEQTIDTKNKSFNFITDDNEEKILSISNKYSLPLGEIETEGSKFVVTHSLGSIMNSYLSRGYNSPIDSDELTFNQKNTIWDFIKEYLKSKEFTALLVSDPRVGYSKPVDFNDLEEHFDLTLYTPNIIKTGTDNLPLKDLDDFLDSFGNVELVSAPTKVGEKIIIETTNAIEGDNLYVGGKYYLTHLKDNFYAIKKLGSISAYTLRCVLTLNS